MWFSKKEAGMFKNKVFETPIDLGGSPVKLVEKRYDLLEGREYRFSMDSKAVKNAAVKVRCFNDVDQKIGSFDSIAKDGVCTLLFALPEGTTCTAIEVSADGNAGSKLENFKFGETGRRTGDNWQAAWICHPQGRRTADPSTFLYSREFDLPALPLDSRIQLTADDGYILKINDKEIAKRIGGWQQTALHDITPFVKAGKNKVEIGVFNENGPTGLICELRFDMADGNTILIKTDKNQIKSKMQQ